ncbi:MAG TPA: hypothetical protein VNZ53_13725 [Steroidobacteraceae bacterium]|nr:hypothetical protein [Steroidobacteraceae bacterium]
MQLDEVGENVGLTPQLIGDRLEIVGITVTRTPRRSTASTSERKSLSPENNTI